MITCKVTIIQKKLINLLNYSIKKRKCFLKKTQLNLKAMKNIYIISDCENIKDFYKESID